MWELDHKEGWVAEELMFLNCGVGEDSWEPLELKEIKLVNLKGNQTWIFIGGTDAEAPVLWPPDVKSWLIGKDWLWERLRARREGDDRGWDGWMVSLTQWTCVWANSWRCWRQGSLVCWSPWGCKELDTTEHLNWNWKEEKEGWSFADTEECV